MVEENESTRTTDSRQLLLNAALKVFAQRGYDGATVKELADTAGVNVSLISYHFGGKEGLFRACLENAGRKKLDLTQRLLKPAATREEFVLRLKVFLEVFVEEQLREPECSQLIQREIQGGSPFIDELFRDVFVKVWESTFDFFRHAQSAGVMRDDVDPRIAAGLLVGGLLHMLNVDCMASRHLGVSIRDEAHRDRVIEQTIRNFTEGVLKR